MSTCILLGLFLTLLALVPPSVPPFPLNYLPVQENWLLPFQANEKRVHQLHDFGKREQGHPQTSGTIAIDPIRGGTDSLLEGVRRDKPQQMRDDTNRTNGTIHCQEEIPTSQGLA